MGVDRAGNFALGRSPAGVDVKQSSADRGRAHQALSILG
jgi:hypothetical protein